MSNDPQKNVKCHLGWTMERLCARFNQVVAKLSLAFVHTTNNHNSNLIIILVYKNLKPPKQKGIIKQIIPKGANLQSGEI